MADDPNLNNPPAPPATPTNDAAATPPADADMQARVDRLGGEAAPDITPEEFARLQKLGGLNIDPLGRVRVRHHEEDDPGVSIRKRRAWYSL